MLRKNLVHWVFCIRYKVTLEKLFQNTVQCDMQHWMITLAASLLNNDVVQKGD